MTTSQEASAAARSEAQHFAWVDIMKATAIYLVVLGHLGQGPFVTAFLWTFHVPVFFFVSGFLTKPSDDGAFLRRIRQRLALPYFYLYLANVLITVVLRSDYDPTSISLKLAGVAYGSHGYPHFVNAALWFLPALIIVEAIYHFLIRRHPVAYAPILLVSYLIYRSGHIDLFLSFDLALLGLNYFLVGTLVRRLNVMQMIEGRQTALILVGSAALALTLWAAQIGNVWYTGPHYALSMIFGLAGILMLLCASALCAPIVRRISFLDRAFGFIGANTLFILAFHLYSSEYAARAVNLLPIGSWIVKTLLIAAASIALLVPANLVVIRLWPSVIGVRARHSSS